MGRNNEDTGHIIESNGSVCLVHPECRILDPLTPTKANQPTNQQQNLARPRNDSVKATDPVPVKDTGWSSVPTGWCSLVMSMWAAARVLSFFPSSAYRSFTASLGVVSANI